MSALIRFCPDCGHIGEVAEGFLSCCPDHGFSMVEPEVIQYIVKLRLKAGEDAYRKAAEAPGMAVPGAVLSEDGWWHLEVRRSGKIANREVAE